MALALSQDYAIRENSYRKPPRSRTINEIHNNLKDNYEFKRDLYDGRLMTPKRFIESKFDDISMDDIVNSIRYKGDNTIEIDVSKIFKHNIKLIDTLVNEMAKNRVIDDYIAPGGGEYGLKIDNYRINDILQELLIDMVYYSIDNFPRGN